MRCDSQAFLLALTFASPYLGYEPKVKVATIVVHNIQAIVDAHHNWVVL
jgi:hypothetical protein